MKRLKSRPIFTCAYDYLLLMKSRVCLIQCIDECAYYSWSQMLSPIRRDYDTGHEVFPVAMMPINRGLVLIRTVMMAFDY